MNKLIKGDTVIVISGKNKGKVSKIIKIKDIKKKKTNIINRFVYLEGVNVAKKAKKGKGFIDVVLPIHISNVKYYDKDSKKSTKINIIVEGGKKKRYLRDLNKKLD